MRKGGKTLSATAAPALTEAFEIIKGLDAHKWRPVEDFAYGERHAPADYLRGVGDRKITLRIVNALLSDPRMVPVWKRIAAMQARTSTLMIAEVDAGCAIARECAVVYSKKVKQGTKAQWKKHHLEIAKTATRLASLLRRDGSTHRALHNLADAFTDDTLPNVAKEVFFNGGANGPGIDAAPAIDAIAESLNTSFARSPLFDEYPKADASTILKNFAARAEEAATIMPFMPSAKTRHRFELALRVRRVPGRELGFLGYEHVATIVSVLTGDDVDGNDIKHLLARFMGNLNARLAHARGNFLMV